MKKIQGLQAPHGATSPSDLRMEQTSNPTLHYPISQHISVLLLLETLFPTNIVGPPFFLNQIFQCPLLTLPTQSSRIVGQNIHGLTTLFPYEEMSFSFKENSRSRCSISTNRLTTSSSNPSKDDLITCRNLPFNGRATRDSWARLPRKEYAQSRHQRLFEENVRKNRKRRSLRILSERFESCIYARGRYWHPTRPSQGTIAFN